MSSFKNCQTYCSTNSIWVSMVILWIENQWNAPVNNKPVPRITRCMCLFEDDSNGT